VTSSDSGWPKTRAGLSADLRDLGVCAGDTLLVHSSLRSIGFVVGGAVAVVQALLDAVGPDGTVVVPAFTADNSDPSRWALTRKEAVPSEWWQQIRDHLPAFDPDLTPSHNIGAIAEAVRTWPGAVRSTHPQTSFAALGADATVLMAGHHPDCHLGPDSPLGRLAEGAAKILLLGVPFEVCTAFHLTEYQVPDSPTRDYECVICVEGERAWYRFRDVALDDADFGRLGAALEASAVGCLVRQGMVGDAVSRLLPLAESVAHARQWLATHRGRPRPV
jgi:aminoglycoside 3-N-acetyltransferase